MRNPPKSILKKHNNLEHQIRTLTRPVVVRLNPLNLSKYKKIGSDYLIPKKSTVPKQVPEPAPMPISTPSPTQPPVRLPSMPILESMPSPIASGSNSLNTVPTVCAECVESFDSIFKQQCENYVAPYEKLLEQEKKANFAAKFKLIEAEKKWNEESQAWSHLANQIDEMQDNLLALGEANHALRLVIGSVSAQILHEHNYAHIIHG